MSSFFLKASLSIGFGRSSNLKNTKKVHATEYTITDVITLFLREWKTEAGGQKSTLTLDEKQKQRIHLISVLCSSIRRALPTKKTPKNK